MFPKNKSEELNHGLLKKNIKKDKEPKSIKIYHACDGCPRIFKTMPGLERHKTLHDCKPQENSAYNEKTIILENLKCDSCVEDFATAHMNGYYKCFDCGNFFKLKSIMDRHHLMVHCNANDFKCPNCEFICTDKDILIEHLCSKHHLGTSRPYSCTVCFKSFCKKSNFLRHNRQAGCDGSAQLKYSCEVCGIMYNRKDKLKDHRLVHDPTPTTRKNRTYTCVYCDKEFLGLSLLYDHQKTHSVYAALRRHQCDICLKQLASGQTLRNHRNMHTGERPFECKQCCDKFITKRNLNLHLKTHAIKPESCALTEKCFELKPQQKAHLFDDNSGNAFTCDKCCVTFSSRSYYDDHIQLFHNSITGLSLCNVCDKFLVQNKDGQPHHIIPPGINARHSCLICELQFTSTIFLNQHIMAKHTMKPQHPCVKCGLTFIRQGWLLYNMRSKNRDLLAEIMADHEDGNTDALEDNDNATSNNSNQKDAFADSLMELLTVLIDESTLKEFGWPDMSVDHLIESVITRFGHTPVAFDGIAYLNNLRGNSKQLFSIIIEDSAIKKLLSDYAIEKVEEQIVKNI